MEITLIITRESSKKILNMLQIILNFAAATRTEVDRTVGVWPRAGRRGRACGLPTSLHCPIAKTYAPRCTPCIELRAVSYKFGDVLFEL
jgi:hypothetical protein